MNLTSKLSDIVIYVGDVTATVAAAAQKTSLDAKLIISGKYRDLSPGIYYTSLGDLDGIEQFVHVLSQAHEIRYVPPEGNWSDVHQGESGMKKWTEFYLRFFNDKKRVISPVSLVNTANCLELMDHRHSNDSQLWSVGCSITHGVGVDPHQRYGQIIADTLGLQISFLTMPGSSLEWAADQIIRSDIRSGDVVIWGLTSINRAMFFHNKNLHHLHVSYYEHNPEFHHIKPLTDLDSDDHNHRMLRCIYQVVNFCRTANVKLYLAGILIDHELLPYVFNLPNYVQFYGFPSVDPDRKFIDLGIDGIHPGVATHAWYAKTLLHQYRATGNE